MTPGHHATSGLAPPLASLRAAHGTLRYVRAAAVLEPGCPWALFSRLWPERRPDWAFRDPQAAAVANRGCGRAVSSMVGVSAVAGQQHRGGSPAVLEAGLVELDRLTLTLGTPPPGGFRAWPTAAVAVPFFAARHRPLPASAGGLWPLAEAGSRAAMGGWRAFQLTLALQHGRAGAELVALWLSRLPAQLCGAELAHERSAAAALAELLAARDRLFQQCRRTQNALLAARPGVTSRLHVPIADARPPEAASVPTLPVPAGQRGEQSFVRRVQRAKRHIARGAMAKVVLARSLSHAPPPSFCFDAWQTAQQLAAQQPTAQVFLWRLAGGQFFVGASPERLLQIAGRRLRTHAVAGTRQVGTEPNDLLESDKDASEHRFVVEGACLSLARCCERIVLGRRRLLQAGQIYHLETPIEARLHRGTSVLAAAAHLHPTPAVLGTPGHAARAWLVREEPWRGLYAGLVGPVGPSGGQLTVAIRSALIAPTRATCFAGAGIVAGSCPAAEYAETTTKLATVQAALAAGCRPSKPA